MARFGNMLSAFSIAELSELLEDDDKLNRIVEDVEEVKEVQQSKEMTLAGNRSLAEQNLELQPRLDHQKNELTKRYRSLQDMFEAYQLRKSTLDHKSGSSSLDTLLALLQTEGAKIEEETENMADSFLNGDVTLDAFIDEYQSKRKLAHLRRVKIEKLQEMVLKSPQLLQAVPQPCRPAPEPTPKPVPLQREINGSPAPVPQPRRAPPLPPIKSPPAAPAPQPAAAFSYPATPYPPIPPRVGQIPPSLSHGYPPVCMPQYPPPVPQRPAPRLAPQPGFIVQ
ncbi:VPS37B subunit of ESCRT-I a [Salminus brasiliensis]|uniref:VPS37B subunit of ESCRT-I a n=1 Tax=Salminus brasiliensis TaxID=930266 RepID=UPI003B83032A